MNDPLLYIASATWRNKAVFSSELATRDAAAAELFTLYPRLKRCATGKGYHGCSHMIFHERRDIMPA